MLSFRKKKLNLVLRSLFGRFLSKGGGEERSVALLNEFVGLSEKLSKLSDSLSNYLEVWRANLGVFYEYHFCHSPIQL